MLCVRAGVPAAATHAAPVHRAPGADHEVAAQRAAAARQAHAHAVLRAVAGGRALGVVAARAVQRVGGQPAPGGGGGHQVHADQRARRVRPAGTNTIKWKLNHLASSLVCKEK